MQWRHFFAENILIQGFDCYKSGVVYDFEVEHDYIQASIEGSMNYDVLIDVSDGNIIDMNCDCQHAESGEYCKHMAAVLFCYEDECEGKNLVRPKSKSNVVTLKHERISAADQLVKKSDEATVRSFLTDILAQDDRIFNRFKVLTSCELSKEDVEAHKKQIDRIFSNNKDRHGFINYANANDFGLELSSFIADDVKDIVNNKLYKEAFEITKYIFIQLCDLAIDDSFGTTDHIAEECVEIFSEILEQSDIALKRTIFDWCIESFTYDLDYLEDYMEQILFGYFKEDEFLAMKIKFVEEKICFYKRRERSCAGKWVLYRTELMRAQNESQAVMDGYLEANLDISDIRVHYVDICLERKDYDTAIKLLQEGKVVDKNLTGYVMNYRMKLKNLYEEIGDKESYKAQLWELFLENERGDLSFYKELKSCYSKKEWEKERDIIFEKKQNSFIIDQLYKEEGLYDRLLKKVLDAHGLWMLQSYEKDLKKLYPQELLCKYEMEVMKMVEHAADRKRYRELAGILKQMQKYPNGAERVYEIVHGWRLKYVKRRAMMEELMGL